MHAIFLDYATVSLGGDLDPAPLRAVLPGLELRDDTPQEHVAAVTARAEVLLVNKRRITRDVFYAAPQLKLIALAATGTDNVDLVAARERGIAVCNLRDYCTPSVVQHVIGSLLMLSNRLRDYDALVRSGQWRPGGPACMPAHPIRELAGRTLGIVGFGALGRGVAHAARGLGMQVLVANRPGGERVAGRIDLDELLPRADALSLHCPLTPATRGLIGAAQLARMQHDALLVNTARGALVDSQALADALRAGRLGGAAIDVFAEEPPPPQEPLLQPGIPNLLLTPHVAWAAREARQRCLAQMASNVADFLRGGHTGRVV